MATKIILLDGYHEDHWLGILQAAIRSMGGELESIEMLHKQRLNWCEYELAILDAGSSGDVVAIIKEILGYNPIIKILVVSDAPRWDQAREVFLAGAADYIRKGTDEAYIKSILSNLIAAKE